jgi:hypothetical protein
MSIHGILEAMRSDLSPAFRLVWQCLENHANGHRFWPMTAMQIAAELHLGVATVNRAIEGLEQLEIVRRELHHRRKTVFHMLRTYPDGGTHRYSDTDLADQNDKPTPDLSPQNDQPTPDLAYQNDQTLRNPPVQVPPVISPRARATRAPRTQPRTSLDSALETGWRPGDKGQTYATDRGVDCAEEWGRFKNHHRSKGTLAASWDATWRTWCDKAVEFGKAPGKRANGHAMQPGLGL